MDWDYLGQELHERLYEKLQALGRYFVISEEMKNALERHDISRIAVMSDKRGCAMENIKRIDKRIIDLTGEKKITMERFPQQVTDKIMPLANKIKGALKALVEIDHACLALAVAEHEARKNDLLRIRTGVAVAKGYGARGEFVSRFLDIKK